MNGLNLAQLPAQNQFEQLEGIDPLNILEDQHNRAIQQLDIQFSRNQQFATRKANNQMDVLQKKYQIEVAALKQKYESIPQNQRDEKTVRRAWEEWNSLNTRYSLQTEGIRGSVQPDIQDLESEKQQQLQRLQTQRNEKTIRLSNVKELAAKGVITDPYAALKEQYEIVGYNIPISEFKPKSPREVAREYISQALSAMSEKDTSGAQTALKQVEGVLEQLPPNEAEAFRKSARLSTLEARRRKPGKEEPGTFASRIIEAKPKTQLEKAREPLGLKPAQQPIYQRNKTTGKTRVSYDGGQTWKTIG